MVAAVDLEEFYNLFNTAHVQMVPNGRGMIIFVLYHMLYILSIQFRMELYLDLRRHTGCFHAT